MYQFFAFVFVRAVELSLAAEPAFVIWEELQATVYVVEYCILDALD